MKAIVFVGTGGGAGVTTLVALTFAGLCESGSAAPWIFAPQHSDTIDRAHQAGAHHPDGGIALWDAGVLRSDAPLARLRGPEIRLVLVAPATPAGADDASAALERIADTDDTLAATSTLVLTGVHGRHRRTPSSRFGAPVHRIPYDTALERPGPVAADHELRRGTLRAIQAWRHWVALMSVDT